MRDLIFYCFFIAVVAILTAAKSDPVRPDSHIPGADLFSSFHGETWTQLTPGVSATIDGFTLLLQAGSSDSASTLSVWNLSGVQTKLPLDNVYPPIYARVSSLRNYILANGACGTKSVCAVIIGLKDYRAWTVSEPARAMYYENHLADVPAEAGHLYVSLVGRAISPDETKVLLDASLVAITYPSRELARFDAGAKYFVPESYVVSLDSGSVLQVISPESRDRQLWRENE